MDRTSISGHPTCLLAAVLAACSAAHTPPDASTIRCTSSDECYGPVPYCDPGLGVCVPCRRDEDCGFECDTASGECEHCVTDAACEGGRGDFFCDPTLRLCVRACVSDEDCVFEPGIYWTCPASLGYCVPCVDGPLCDPELHVPVECVTDEHCSPSEPICHARECTTTCDAAGGCPDGRHCERGSMLCVECTMNAHCPDSWCTSEFRCRW